jgi:hypothetical protein
VGGVDIEMDAGALCVGHAAVGEGGGGGEGDGGGAGAEPAVVVEARTWDCGGQKLYKGTNLQIFFSRRSVQPGQGRHQGAGGHAARGALLRAGGTRRPRRHARRHVVDAGSCFAETSLA